MKNYPVEYPRQFTNHLVSKQVSLSVCGHLQGIKVGRFENHKTLIMAKEFVNKLVILQMIDFCGLNNKSLI